MPKIKLLVVSPYTKDANSFHRAVGPWSYFAKWARKHDFDFDFDVAGEDLGQRGVAWDVVGRYDAVFFHRPCREDDLTILKLARLMNIPSWVEYDDWLFDVPPWNPHAGVYASPGIQNMIATCIAAADMVSVTTTPLYDKFRLVNPNVSIIPNSYRYDLYPYRKYRELPSRKNEIAWRGSNTHDADILSVGRAWGNLPAPVNFYGGAPWVLTTQMKPGSHRVVSSQDPFLYMRTIYGEAPRVLVCPLVDCFFNRCKSNIAYQEAMHAGALCVAPDMPEWVRPGVITYKPGDDASFLGAIQQVFDMRDADRDDAANAGYEHMRKHYDASVINQTRLEVLEHIVSLDFKRNERDPWDQLLGVWSLGQLKNQMKSQPA